MVPTPVVTPHAIAGARQSLAGSRTPASTTAAVAVAAAIVCASCDNVIVKDVRHIGLVEEKMFKPDPVPTGAPQYTQRRLNVVFVKAALTRGRTPIA